METLAVAAERCALVEFFYGEPDPALVEAIHAGGPLAAWQVGSVAEARRAEAAGVDVVILQGIEAGGHLRATQGLWPMLAEALDIVGVPIVAAGGFSSPHDGRRARRRGRRCAPRHPDRRPHFAGFAPVGDADGDIEAMACFAGEGVGSITDIRPGVRSTAILLTAG